MDQLKDNPMYRHLMLSKTTGSIQETQYPTLRIKQQ